MKGFIKDYRQELKSDIWFMPPLYHRVWQYLKYMVNHDDRKVPMKDGSFFTVKKGQHLTSVRSVAQGVGYYEGMKWKEPNPKTISTILSWLEKQQMIGIERGKGNKQYTLITLLNWEMYQSKNNEGNSKETVDGEGRKQLADINKNYKELLKNDKEDNYYYTRDENFGEIIRYYQTNLQKGIVTTEKVRETIIQLYEEWGYELLLAAMKVAAKKEAKGVAFIESVLESWKDARVQTVEDARKYESEFRENQKKNYRSNQPAKKEVLPKWFEEEKKNRQVQQPPKATIEQNSNEDTEKKRAELQAFIKNYKQTKGG